MLLKSHVIEKNFKNFKFQKLDWKNPVSSFTFLGLS